MNVGSAWVVALEVAIQPPWSIATSTIAEPGFMALMCSAVTSLGAAAPGISTPPITKSASSTCFSSASAVE